ncbi:EF-hand domain-containing protein [Hyphococcus sp.]|uniref:EF-hand domain-containing protein n=1 Tax=Hyphococcus sp. TaxID=2038636 RepID=UPI0035C6CB35
MPTHLHKWTAILGAALALSLPAAYAQGGEPMPTAPKHQGIKQKFRLHDQNGDAMLSKEEFDAWHETMFDALAADGDGFTLEDFLAMRMGPGPKGAMNPERQKQMQEKAAQRKTARFEAMDADGDAKVTRTEFMDFESKVFEDADVNDDGQLTEAELIEHHRAM